MLHVVPGLHFVDSPEWFGVAADDYFQVRNYYFTDTTHPSISMIRFFFTFCKNLAKNEEKPYHTVWHSGTSVALSSKQLYQNSKPNK